MANTKEKILKAMEEEIRARGQATPLNLALINDYGKLYDMKENLIEDIKTRGVSVPYRECKDGTILKKKNDCIPELTKVIGQMSKITFDLGIRACDLKVEDVPINL